MNALEPMITKFHFIFKEAGGGGGGGEGGGGAIPASAQTGDMLSVLLAVIFLIVAVALVSLIFFKIKSNSNKAGLHVATKSIVSARTIAVGIGIVLAICGCA